MPVIVTLKKWWHRFIGRYVPINENNTRQRDRSPVLRCVAYVESNDVVIDCHAVTIPKKNNVSFTIKTSNNNSTVRVSCKDRKKKQLKKCACANCKILPTLTKCAVCFLPVLDAGFLNCKLCSNHTCNNCNVYLEACPYCRQPSPWEKNVALLRFIDQLAHSCKYYRSGCPEILDTTKRAIHQKICCYKTVSCSVDEVSCTWFGPIISLEDHLTTVHNVSAERQNTVYCKLDHSRNGKFENKVLSNYLNCYNQIFKITCTRDNEKFTIELHQLGYVRFVPQAEFQCFQYKMLSFVEYDDPDVGQLKVGYNNPDVNQLKVDEELPSTRQVYVLSKLFPKFEHDDTILLATIRVVIVQTSRNDSDM